MSQISFTDSALTNEGECHHLFQGKAGPTIKILLYTDAPNVFTLKDAKFHGLALMLQHLGGHAPAFANLCIKWVSRYSAGDSPEVRKINVVLKEELSETKKPFDQIWFFGFRQGNVKRFSLGLVPNSPNGDLDELEVSALTDWMDAKGNPGGGVLMMGDHSEPAGTHPLIADRNALRPDNSTSAEFLSLGRGLGRCVPRAGRLRTWDGGPTRTLESHNTLHNLGAQGDSHPQELLLKWFDEKGEASPGGQPHPLFFYRRESWIKVFPDHQHEGAVVIPKIAPDDKEWPKSTHLRPLPRVVACGINKRNCEIINLVAAYDGDLADVGRIVADSTWHHYTSMNLTGLSHPAPVGSDADQIGQYYGNLAVWLSPLNKRREMAQAMFSWLATHPMMLEEVGGDTLEIGRVAYAVLSNVASPCEIHELLLAAVPHRIRENFETLYFPETGFVLSELPSKELILGCVIDAYHNEMIKVENLEDPDKLLTIAEATDSGFEAAFDRQWKQIERIESSARKLIKLKA